MSVRVLLIGAHDDARAGLAQRLTRNSDVDLVGVARDAGEARGLANARPDLVLVDLYEDDNGERELCRELADVFPTPIVVLTSFMTRDHWSELQGAGVSSYLLRRVDTRRLADELVHLAAQANGAKRAAAGPASAPSVKERDNE
jgi:DNA-binding NarL/FixJ family response regulator